MLISPVIRAVRPPFLVLTPATMLLAFSAAGLSNEAFNVIHASLCFLGALFAHISVNSFNEYFDYQSGLDLNTDKTPFSGGSGALPDYPDASAYVLGVAVFSLLTVIGIGVFFIFQVNPHIIWFGLAGIIIIVTYTNWINKRAWICLVAPGLCFGPFMILGTGLILNGHISLEMVCVSIVSFCLTNNLLLLNQLPDIQADKAIGRAHFPIIYGLDPTIFIFLAFNSIGAVSVILLFMMSENNWLLLPMLMVLLCIPVAIGIVKSQLNIQRLIPFLGINVGIAVVVPIALGTAIYLG